MDSNYSGRHNEGFEPDPNDRSYSIPRIRTAQNENGYKTADSLNLNAYPNPTAADLSEKGKPSDELDSEDDDVEEQFDDLEWEPTNFIAKGVSVIEREFGSLCSNAISKRGLQIGIFTILFLLYNAYLITAIAYTIRNDQPIQMCDGLGFLSVVTGIVYWSLLYYHALKPLLGKVVSKHIFDPIGNLWDKCWKFVIFRLIFGGILLGGLITFLVIDTEDNRRRLISAAGIPILLLIGLILSKHPSRVVWRHIFWGTGLQFGFGLLILRWEVGKNVSECLSGKVETFLDFTKAGSYFVFGFMAEGYDSSKADPPVLIDSPIVLYSTFAFGVLSVIFFFSFCVALLYNIGAMTWVVVKIGWMLQVTMGTTAAESMSASANIFLGQTEAPLVVKPFLKDMTKSELHSIMTGGFATIAGTVMGAFISFGIDPAHLLSASFMSAPAALAFSKLIYPETKVSRTTSEQIYQRKEKSSGNALDAAASGASQAIYLVANIIASLIAFMAFMAFMDAVLGWFGHLVGFDEFSFQWLLAKLFYPLAFIIGIDPDDLDIVARLLGIKTVVNEFVAYQELGLMKDGVISARSKAITTYALCSFSNISSVGIQLGGLGAIAPTRRKEMSQIIWRALIAGNAAALMTACVAGTLVA